MAGRRLTDLAALLSASSTIARQHLSIRSAQWTTYRTTSSILPRPQLRRTAGPSSTITPTPGAHGEYTYAPTPSSTSPESTPAPTTPGLHSSSSSATRPVKNLPTNANPPLGDDVETAAATKAESLKRGTDSTVEYIRHPESSPKLEGVLEGDATGVEGKVPGFQQRDQPVTEAGLNSSVFSERATAGAEGGVVESARDEVRRERPVPERVARGEEMVEVEEGKRGTEVKVNETAGVEGEGVIPSVVARGEEMVDVEENKRGDEVVENVTTGRAEGKKVEKEKEVDVEAWEALEENVFMSRRARGLLKNVKRNEEAVKESKGKVDEIEEAVEHEAERILGKEVPEVEVKVLAEDIAREIREAEGALPKLEEAKAYEMKPSRVPSSRFGRAFHYGGLGAGMIWGAAKEKVMRTMGGGGDAGTSVMFSERNVEMLVKKLSRMRGAALKLGQMMSIQDSNMLPPPLQSVLSRVQDSADYMPSSQRDTVLAENLGPNWRSLFSHFEEVPIAAASIGQVHRAVLASNSQPVAIKIQYPGVASSISSDLSNLAMLLTASRLLPKGLYLDKTIANARTELAWECDYTREAEAAKRFAVLLAGESDTFRVPKIYDEASGPTVLTMEMMKGKAVTKMIPELTQSDRDFIGTAILGLCLREVAKYKFMQTDPNWTNFLYNALDRKVELLDFGASREYPDAFVKLYTDCLKAAAARDRGAVESLSLKLGYLTGLESKQMTAAHVDSVMCLAEPFSKELGMEEVYDFEKQTVTDRVRSQMPLMINERLTPPPEETYSLHRKLSGAFLLCARLGSRVQTRRIFVEAMGTEYDI